MQNGLTIRQDRLADYLLDPRVKTQKEAGRLAGYADTPSLDSIVSIAIRNEKFIAALDRRRAEQSDTGLGFRALIHRLQRLQARALQAFEKAIEKLEQSDDGLDLQVAGSVAKLASDLQINAGKLKELLGDEQDQDKERHASRLAWERAVVRVVQLSSRVTRRFGVESAQRFAVGIAAKVERQLLRQPYP